MNTEQFEVLKGLPFYDWESSKINPTKIDFNHAIGLPRKKDGVPVHYLTMNKCFMIH